MNQRFKIEISLKNSRVGTKLLHKSFFEGNIKIPKNISKIKILNTNESTSSNESTSYYKSTCSNESTSCNESEIYDNSIAFYNFCENIKAETFQQLRLNTVNSVYNMYENYGDNLKLWASKNRIKIKICALNYPCFDYNGDRINKKCFKVVYDNEIEANKFLLNNCNIKLYNLSESLMTSIDENSNKNVLNTFAHLHDGSNLYTI